MNWTQVKRINSHSPENRWILSLPGAGCSWAKRSGGCYMCNFKSATDKYTFGKLLPSLVFTNLYKLGYYKVKKNAPNSIFIFNGGSFLNEREIPLTAQKRICLSIAKDPLIEKLVVESRPEYITDEKLTLLKKNLGNKELVIAIGLETKSDIIRKKSINKGFSLKEFETAVNTIEKNKAKLLTYVFLKPLFLDEKEAIEEAVDTINYAFEVGSSEVDIEAATVVEGTKMEALYKNGEFSLPWLWSIIEVVKRTHHLGHLHVGCFDDNPPPIAIPSNCDECSPEIEALFAKFNEHQDFSILDSPECSCKKQWIKELAV